MTRLKIKDMTTEQKRQYYDQKREEKRAQWRHEEEQRKEWEVARFQAVEKWMAEVRDDLKILCAPVHARTILDSLGADAVKVLMAFVSLRCVDQEDARALTGFSAKKFSSLYAALWNCAAIVPNVDGFEWVAYADDMFAEVSPHQFIGIQHSLQSRALFGVKEFISDRAGDVLNPSIEPLLKISADIGLDAFLNRTLDLNENGCTCRVCNPNFAGMYLCKICGNKRCPHAADHKFDCTNSNEPGQVGTMAPDAV